MDGPEIGFISFIQSLAAGAMSSGLGFDGCLDLLSRCDIWWWMAMQPGLLVCR